MAENFTIVSIDPGTNTGIAIYEISPKDFSIVSLETLTVVLSEYGDLLAKLVKIKKTIASIIETYNPIIVSVEAAFLNIRFPKAVMQLSQIISAIELTIKTINSDIKIFEYPPKYIKKIIATGTADKDDMTEAVLKIKELSSNININHMSEHEVDAMSIGYVTLLEIRKTPFILYSIM